MSNDSIILDLMGRLIELEKEVEKLKEQIKDGSYLKDSVEEIEIKVPTKKRSELRNEIIDKLKENNPDKKKIRVSNREEGSGITIEEADESKKSYLLRTSNNVASDKSQGWFTIGEVLVDKIIDKELSGVILYSYYDDPHKNIIVIMNSEEFKDYMNQKGFENKDSNGRYHLYIENRDDGIFEIRDGDIDISSYSNKFEI